MKQLHTRKHLNYTSADGCFEHRGSGYENNQTDHDGAVPYKLTQFSCEPKEISLHQKATNDFCSNISFPQDTGLKNLWRL